jgi:hypothetical protein
MTSQIEKRPRSPCVPFIGLLAATARARQLYDRAKQDSLGVTDLAGIWGLAPKSSALLQTIAALLAYGLAQTGKNGGRARFVLAIWQPTSSRSPLPVRMRHSESLTRRRSSPSSSRNMLQNGRVVGRVMIAASANEQASLYQGRRCAIPEGFR